MTDYEAAFWKLKNNWDASVRHYEERIDKLEAANLKQSCVKVDDQMRIEKLEEALSNIIWDCPHEGPEDWCGDEYCPCKQAFAALEKESD